MIAIIGLLVGVAVGILWHPVVPIWLEPYLPIAIVAAIDAVFGGFRALIERRFDERIFVVSFLSNVLIASFLVFLGDQLGVGAQMSTGWSSSWRCASSRMRRQSDASSSARDPMTPDPETTTVRPHGPMPRKCPAGRCCDNSPSLPAARIWSSASSFSCSACS